MVHQLGIASFFLTLSAADMQWASVLINIARIYGLNYSEDDIQNMSWKEKVNLLSNNPVEAARHFQYRVELFFNEFLKSQAHPLGVIKDYVIGIEFQNRGSPHIHCALWIKDAPIVDKDADDKVIDFIDKYISGAIPSTDEALEDLVKKRQMHVHNSSCLRNGKCRYNIPKAVSSKTIIAREPIGENRSQELQYSLTVLAKFQDTMKDVPPTATLDDILEKSSISIEAYEKALSTSKHGTTIVLKRDLKDSFINNYNVPVLSAWEANMDIQFIVDSYALVMYICSYMLKAEKAIGEVLKHASREVKDKDICEQMRHLGGKYLNHREVSAQEAIYRLLSLPLRKLSREVMFINTNTAQKRVRLLKKKTDLEKLSDDSEDIYFKGVPEKYVTRPNNLEHLCLADFVSCYVIHKPDTSSNNIENVDENAADFESTEQNDIADDKECDNDPNYNNEVLIDECNNNSLDLESDNAIEAAFYTLPSAITLGNGCIIKKRKKMCIIRYYCPKIDKDPENYFRTLLMLFRPWRDEALIMEGFHSYQEAYEYSIDEVTGNENKYTRNGKSINEAFQLLQDIGPPQHAWNELAPNNEDIRAQDDEEGVNVLQNVEEGDLDDNLNLLKQKNMSQTSITFEKLKDPVVMQPQEFNSKMRGLNRKQNLTIEKHRKWCRNALLAMKGGRNVESYRMFISGPGGVGKSHVIFLLFQTTLKLLKRTIHFDPDDVVIMLLATTGVAAFNISGITVHAALGLSPFTNAISTDKLNSLRTQLKALMVVVIDEVSMLSSDMLIRVDERLRLIKGNNYLFGGVSVIAVGDLYQLKPVKENYIFGASKNDINNILNPFPLFSQFDILELTEVVRQQDPAFASLLCNVRKATCSQADHEVLRSCEITPDMVKYLHMAHHVFATNKEVDLHNFETVKKLKEKMFFIPAQDSKKDIETNLISVPLEHQPLSATGNLKSVLHICKQAQVMMTINLDVSDGLVNGATARVEDIIVCNIIVETVLVKFHSEKVGIKAIAKSPFKGTHPNAVPIYRCQANFSARGQKNKYSSASVSRRQFPLVLSFATTVHKVQGLTLDEIVVCMKSRYEFGQCYVALSRVRTLEGLHIRDYSPHKIKTHPGIAAALSSLKEVTEEQNIVDDRDGNDTVIGHLNVNGYRCHQNDITACQLINSIDCICFSETHLHPDDVVFSPWSTGFSARKDRRQITNQAGGGVAIAVRPDIENEVYEDCTMNNLEYVVHIVRDTVVMVVYRRPMQRLQDFLKLMKPLVQSLPKDSPCVIMGDFNEDLLHNAKSPIVVFF